jgi:hypothetical protein
VTPLVSDTSSVLADAPSLAKVSDTFAPFAAPTQFRRVSDTEAVPA